MVGAVTDAANHAHQFDRETAVAPRSPSEWTTHITSNWNIGDNPNGGYLLSSGIKVAVEASGQPDPLTVTTHYLRPGLPDQPADIDVDVVRRGRRFTNVDVQLTQDGKPRYKLMAAMGDLSGGTLSDQPIEGAALTREPVDLPPPDECTARMDLEQGVDLAITSRLDIRVDPKWAEDGSSDRAEISGWIRFKDERPVDTAALVLFGDSFPPSLFSLLGRVGWVPTLELTVHVRRRPVPGWISARFRTTDLHDGLLIEDGELWDEAGHLVARTRQLALLL